MNSNTEHQMTILMADDDPDDRLLTEEALEKARLVNPIDFVEDGEQLLDYLWRRNKYADRPEGQQPGLILLDLNMPKVDGREALAKIKTDPELRHIPIVVLTTSNADADVMQTYGLGTNSYIVKPVTFEQLVEVVKEIGRYWFEIVRLPAA